MQSAALFDMPASVVVEPPLPPGPVDPGRTYLQYGETDRWSYLGTHQPSWLERPEFGGSLAVPLCVSHRRLVQRRSLPRAGTSWMLDSGGFTELSLYGDWTVPPAQYAAAVRRYADEIGELERAAIQDWMCEPQILAKTGQTVYDHQCRTVASYLNLMWHDDDLPWMPVLQGWTRDDYLRCVDMYAAMGIDLTVEPLVGLGSVCRRQSTKEAVRIVETLYGLGIRLHGFGFKVTGLREVHHLLYSSDSLAWSFNARRHAPLPGCTHKTCSNCPRYALAWRNCLLASLSEWRQDSAAFPFDLAA
ncbi:hypothetical protein Z951_02720 [Streptomyces sp. PRh5]|nr:hypothetical protein Z951_02720 [Streptomyces sp. PRh5]